MSLSDLRISYFGVDDDDYSRLWVFLRTGRVQPHLAAQIAAGGTGMIAGGVYPETEKTTEIRRYKPDLATLYRL